MEVTTHISHLYLKRARLAVFLFYFMQGLCFSSWASRIPDIKTTLGLNNASWGTILLMIPLGQIMGMAFSGFAVSKFGSKRILRYAVAGYALALIGIGCVQTELALLGTLVVFGLFGNFCNISINTQGVTIESMYTKPIMASFHGGWSLAGLVGGAVGLIMTSSGITPLFHFTLIALVVIVNAAVNIRYLQPDIRRAEQAGEVKTRRKPESFLFWLGTVAFCAMAAEGAMADWSGLYLKDIVKMPHHLAPLGLTVYMVTMAGGRFFVDRFTQQWGRKRVLQGGGTFIFLGLSLAVIHPHPILTLIAFMITGMGTASIVPTVYSVAGQKTRIPASIALTLVSSISFLGFLLGPPLIGYLSEATSLRYSYGLIALAGICIAILASRVKILKTA
ncbi:MAG: MFS transporter [Mangrovibacterium sp.]|nr:MFS transporter [Mangrovibacterium sp.]